MSTNFVLPAILALALLVLSFGRSDEPPPFAMDAEPSGATAEVGVSSAVYFSRCAEARATGVAPIHVGEPGYRKGLDADGDGIACEPYRGS